MKFFAPDVDLVRARVMAAVQQPIAANEFLAEEPFGGPVWRSHPSWYLVTENDQMVPPAAQRFMAQRMKATVSSVAGSHASMVSHADVVANLIMKVAQAVRAK